MGLLSKLFGKKPTVSRPFFHNNTKEEYREWFLGVPPWNSIDTKVLDLLIDKMAGNKLFEVFVFVSLEANLIKEYASFNKWANTELEFAILPHIAGVLLKNGAANLNLFTNIVSSGSSISDRKQKELAKYYGAVMDSCESAITVEPNIVHAYIPMAIVKMMLNKKDESKKFCKLGLDRAKEILNSPMPADLKENVNEAVVKLNEILVEIDGQ